MLHIGMDAIHDFFPLTLAHKLLYSRESIVSNGAIVLVFIYR